MIKLTSQMCQHANLPQVHWKTRFTAIPDDLPYKVRVKAYCDNIVQALAQGQGFYFWGPYSAGKSGLAALCVKSAMCRRQSAFWVTSKELPGMVINKVRTLSGTLVEDALYDSSLLVIDEFQIRKDKEIKYTEALTEDIVRRRVDAGRSTIVTSNLVLTDLRREYPAFHAVLQESLYPLKIDGCDFRKPIGGKVANGLF